MRLGCGYGHVPAHRLLNLDGSEGGCVADTAKVEPAAYVEPDAAVFGKAIVSGWATICDDTRVYGDATLNRGDGEIDSTPAEI